MFCCIAPNTATLALAWTPEILRGQGRGGVSLEEQRLWERVTGVLAMVSGPLEKSQGPPHWQYKVCEVATCLDVCFEGVCVCVCVASQPHASMSFTACEHSICA